MTSRTGRAVVLALGLALALGLVFGLSRPARVAIQALLLLPAVFPSPPVDPLGSLTPSPGLTQATFAYSGGTINARIFHPGGGGQHGAVMLLLGVGELPREDLGVRFAEALARLGLVTMLPESSGLLAEHVNQAEVDGLSSCYQLLVGQPDVDPSRTAVIGLSAAAGLGIVAAAQPSLRDRLRLVTSLGGYYDARSLLLDVVSGSIDLDGQVVAWSPDERTVSVVRQALLDAGSDPDPLFAGLSRDEAQAQIAALPESVQQHLAEISPSAHLSEVRAHLYLLHDRDDTFIPFTESRALVRAAPPGLVQRYTEFAIFAHVIPDRPVPWQTFLPDVWALYWDVHAILLELL
jgi:dienelactone hydrolase